MDKYMVKIDLSNQDLLAQNNFMYICLFSQSKHIFVGTY